MIATRKSPTTRGTTEDGRRRSSSPSWKQRSNDDQQEMKTTSTTSNSSDLLSKTTTIGLILVVCALVYSDILAYIPSFSSYSRLSTSLSFHALSTIATGPTLSLEERLEESKKFAVKIALNNITFVSTPNKYPRNGPYNIPDSEWYVDMTPIAKALDKGECLVYSFGIAL